VPHADAEKLQLWRDTLDVLKDIRASQTGAEQAVPDSSVRNAIQQDNKKSSESVGNIIEAPSPQEEKTKSLGGNEQ
jgi:hypothetical protein